MVLQSGGVAGRAIIPLEPGWSRWSGRLLGGYCTYSGAKAKVEEIFVDQAVSSGRSPGSPRLLRRRGLEPQIIGKENGEPVT